MVLLKDAEKKLMVTGFCYVALKENNRVYDYCGCLYPDGVINTEGTLLFNHSDIDKICSLGYIDEECKLFMENFKEVSKAIKKEKVEEKEDISSTSGIEML